MAIVSHKKTESKFRVALLEIEESCRLVVIDVGLVVDKVATSSIEALSIRISKGLTTRDTASEEKEINLTRGVSNMVRRRAAQ